MSMTSATSATPFRVGAAVTKAIDVYRAGFFKFVALTAIPMAPALVVEIVAARMPDGAQGGLSALSTGLQYVLGALATGTCLYGAFQIMRGKPFTIGKSLSAAGGRLAGLIGAEFISALMTAVGLALLVVPGVVIACALYVALPALMVERMGPLAALRRSRALTHGHRWSIFGVLALFLLMSAIATGVVVALIAAIVAVEVGDLSDLAATGLAFVALVIVEAFAAVLSAVVYHDLRVAKEGVDVEHLSGVFA